VTTTWIIEPINVLEQGTFDLTARLPLLSPDEFGLQAFEESFRHSIIPTITFSAHGYFERMLA
jgi:hypothetical protein